LFFASARGHALPGGLFCFVPARKILLIGKRGFSIFAPFLLRIKKYWKQALCERKSFNVRSGWMKKATIFLAMLQVAILLGSGFVRAQGDLRAQLFANTDAVVKKAKKKQADILAPKNYQKAMQSYQKADRDFKKGRNLEDIRKYLRQSQAYLQKAIEATKLAEVTFSSTTGARNDAKSAEAARFAPEEWNKAEAKFKEAARELENGDVNDAKRKGADAEKMYRMAELEAIKANYLTPAWTLLEKADRLKVKKNAPKSLARARKYATKAEDLLRKNRYDNDEARQLAQEAKYEAAHAIFLNRMVEKIKDSKSSYEDIFLAVEKPITEIAGNLDLVAHFDQGYEKPKRQIIAKIDDIQEKLRLALEVIEKRNSEIKNLQQQITSMESRLGNLTAAEQELQEKLEKQRQQEEMIFQVSRMFSSAEAKVLREGNNVIIRLYGLSFPVGRSTILPEYFALLTKVQTALRKFPNAQYVIEGHTDSQGSDQQNQLLSEERAEAVKRYLLANMSIAPSQIRSVGYGESKPVSSNETSIGRAKNRRIDIVIIPEWADTGSD